MLVNDFNSGYFSSLKISVTVVDDSEAVNLSGHNIKFNVFLTFIKLGAPSFPCIVQCIIYTLHNHLNANIILGSSTSKEKMKWLG